MPPPPAPPMRGARGAAGNRAEDFPEDYDVCEDSYDFRLLVDLIRGGAPPSPKKSRVCQGRRCAPRHEPLQRLSRHSGKEMGPIAWGAQPRGCVGFKKSGFHRFASALGGLSGSHFGRKGGAPNPPRRTRSERDGTGVASVTQTVFWQTFRLRALKVC